MPQRILRILGAALVLTLPIDAADGISADAKTYLEAALTIMQEHHLHKATINWEQIRSAAFARAEGAQSNVDTYPAIRFALGQLRDRHSYLQLSPDLARLEASRTAPIANSAPATPQATSRQLSPFQNRRTPEGSILDTKPRPIAHIVVPFFIGTDVDPVATKLQSIVADLASKAPCGWVVDLRGNGGGNMWPMLAGVGPILGEGEPGSFLDDKGTRTRWFYGNGRAGLRAAHLDYYAKTTEMPVVLPAPPPVAVLIDRGTASSGEAIAVAFRGRPDTRFFGEPTFGVANSTFPYNLPDGAQLLLLVAVDLDRNGTEYTAGIQPDEAIASPAGATTDDSVLRAASDWLTRRESCRVPAN